MDSDFVAVFKKSLHNPRQQGFSPMFSSSSFNVLGFSFGCRIHFELKFFFNGARYGSKFFFFLFSFFSLYIWDIHYHRCADYPFSTELPLHLCQKSVVHLYTGLLPDYYIPLISFSICMLIPPCLHYCSFVSQKSY